MSGILIMAGGTGGHVFPGLAVARRLRAAQMPVVWLGTREGLEARVVPATQPDIQMEWITIRGVRGKGFVGWLLLPFRLGTAMLQAFGVFRRRRPAVVLSLGGFVSGPGGLIAWLTRTPLLIHEQNAIPGLTNRWLAFFADRVLCGFPNAFRETRHALHVGNPVRSEIAQLPSPSARLAGRGGRLRLLVIGGSLGAAALNERVPRAVALLPPDQRPEVWHQCGRHAEAGVRATYAEAGLDAKVTEFIDDMPGAYAWADLVLCRAGAMTVAELSAAGVAAILVPFPFAVDDHQTANARYLEERGAAVRVPQHELTPDRLAELLRQFTDNRSLLGQMAEAARACSIRDADEVVARMCLEAAHA